MDFIDVAKYSGVQLFAGACAGFAYYGLFGTPVTLEPKGYFGILSAGVAEMLYTFVLCFVVLNVAVAKKNKTDGGSTLAWRLALSLLRPPMALAPSRVAASIRRWPS